MKALGLAGVVALLFLLQAGERPARPTGIPVGVLLQAGKNAKLIPFDQESSVPPAQTGALLFDGWRIQTGGDPLSFVYYYPKTAIYTFTPKYSALPLRNLDLTKPDADYEVRFEKTGVVRRNLDPAISTAVPSPLLMPNVPGLGKRELTTEEVSQLVQKIDAALRSASSPLDTALLRLSRAAALERGYQLEEAKREYQQLAGLWKQAAWIATQKIPAIDRQIKIEQRKTELARRATGRTLAVLVAVSDYKYTSSATPASQISRAEFAERDLTLLRTHLESPRGGSLKGDALGVLSGPKATVFSIRNTLRSVLETGAGPNDTVLIFVSGQGWTDTIGGQSKGFLMAYDSNPQDKATSAYPLEELGDLVRANVSRVKNIYLIADVCRLAAVSETSNRINSLLKAQFDSVPRGAEILLSSSADLKPVEVSRTDASLEGGHSIFSYYLVKGLEGAADYDRNGKVTPDEIYRYVSERVTEATKGSQQPVHFGSIAAGTSLSPLVASAQPLQRPPNRNLLAFAGRPHMELLSLLQAVAPEAPPLQAQQSAAGADDPTALEDEGHQILLQYMNGEETPPTPQDFDRGADRFREAYAKDPTPAVLARLLFFQGRSKVAHDDPAAADDLRAALLLDPEGAYSYNALGIAFLRRASFADAAGAFRDATNRAPHWVYPRHNLGLTYAEAGVYDAAEREYREAIRMEPSYSYVHYSLAMLLHKLGRKKEAEREYREAIEKNSGHPEPHIGLGALLASTGKRKEAETEYETAIHLNAAVPAAAHDLGLLYAQDKKPEKAIATWKENVRLNPQFLPSHMSLAKAYVERRQFDEAIAEYQAVLDVSKDFAAAKMALHEAQGDRYRDAKQMEQARAEYKKALEFASAQRDKKRLNGKAR